MSSFDIGNVHNYERTNGYGANFTGNIENVGAHVPENDIIDTLKCIMALPILIILFSLKVIFMVLVIFLGIAAAFVDFCQYAIRGHHAEWQDGNQRFQHQENRGNQAWGSFADPWSVCLPQHLRIHFLQALEVRVPQAQDTHGPRLLERQRNQLRDNPVFCDHGVAHRPEHHSCQTLEQRLPQHPEQNPTQAPRHISRQPAVSRNNRVSLPAEHNSSQVSENNQRRVFRCRPTNEHNRTGNATPDRVRGGTRYSSQVDSVDNRTVVTCPVCLESSEEKKLCRGRFLVTRCRHVFCVKCMKRLLEFGSPCPVCREELHEGDLRKFVFF